MSGDSSEEGEAPRHTRSAGAGWAFPSSALFVAPAPRARSRSRSLPRTAPLDPHTLSQDVASAIAAAGSLAQVKAIVDEHAHALSPQHDIALSAKCAFFVAQDAPVAKILCLDIALHYLAQERAGGGAAASSEARECIRLAGNCVHCGVTARAVLAPLAARIAGALPSLAADYCASVLKKLAPHLGIEDMHPLACRTAQLATELSASGSSAALLGLASLRISEAALALPVASAVLRHARVLSIEHLTSSIAILPAIGDVGRQFVAPLLHEALCRLAAGALSAESVALLLRSALCNSGAMDRAAVQSLTPLAQKAAELCSSMPSALAALALHAVALLGFDERSVTLVPLEALCARAGQLDGRAVYQALEVLVALKCREPQRLVPVLEQTARLASQGGIDAALASQCLRHVGALLVGQARYLDPLEACILGGLQDLLPRHVCSALAALALVRPAPYPSALLDRLRAREVLEALEPQQAAAAAWAVTCCRVAEGCAQSSARPGDVELLGELSRRALAVPEGQLSVSSAVMLLQSHFAQPGPPLQPVPSQLAEGGLLAGAELERCRVAGVLCKDASAALSHMQRKVWEVALGLVGQSLGGTHAGSHNLGSASGLNGLRVAAVECEVALEDASGRHRNLLGMHSADILVTFAPDVTRLVLEVDGPSHYLVELGWGESTLQPSGATLLRNRVIQDAGYYFAVIPYSEFDALAGEERAGYIFDVLERGVREKLGLALPNK